MKPTRGKSICKQLKALRHSIAEENGIPLEQRECTYEGPCRGTCPRCEAEVQYLERALASRLKLGKAATVAGLSLSLAACGNGQGGPLVEADSLSDGEVFEEVGPEDTLMPPPPFPDSALPELEGIVALGDPNYPEEFTAPKNSQKDDFYDGYYTEPPVKAEFPGGQKALERWLDRHVQTPSQFEEDGIVGEVVAALRIESDGHVSGYRIIKGLEGCNNEARRVINTMPRWKPADIPGKGPVASIVTVSIPFMAVAVTGYVVDDQSDVFVIVDEEPQFPGGQEALYKWLEENIKYPKLAKENGIEGKVYVTFVIEKDGSITNAKLLRDIGGGCGAEAVRAVMTMPRWIPAKQRGETVRCQFNLPVTFTLTEEEREQAKRTGQKTVEDTVHAPVLYRKIPAEK